MSGAGSGSAFDAHVWFRQRTRWNWGDAALFVALAVPPVIFPGYLMLGSQVAIMALFAVSLDLILGYAGILSFGHALFFGVGAYIVAFLAKAGWGDCLTGLVVAGAVAAVAGWAVSFVVVRARGLAQIMVTLGLSLLVVELANSNRWLTGGADGLTALPIWPVLGRFDFDLHGVTAYTYAALVLLGGFFFARRLVASPFGLSLRGIRDNPERMAAIGTPVRRRQQTVFTIAAAMAGVAGALLSQTTATVSLETLGFQRSTDVVIALVLGGTGRLYGAIVGAAVLLIARDRLASGSPEYWTFWVGVLLMVVVLWSPKGILGGLGRFRLSAGGGGG